MRIKCIYKLPRIFVKNIRPLPILKFFFYLFEFSYFIFHTLSYFYCRMATLPVTPKKESKENYFPKQRLLSKENFAVLISAIQHPRCGRSLWACSLKKASSVTFEELLKIDYCVLTFFNILLCIISVLCIKVPDSLLLIIQDKGVKIMFEAGTKALFARYFEKDKRQYCI